MPFLVRLAAALLLAGASLAQAQQPAIQLSVDAGEAPRKIFHVRMSVPASPGPLTLVYPKWIPGEHGPTGPIADVAGLKFSAAGKPLSWRRDPVDMYMFHVEPSAGASSVDVEFDYLSPAAAEGFSSGASATAQMAVVSWNQVLLYPQGRRAADVTFTASLRLPPGWKFGTALPVNRESGNTIEFQPVSLETLVDSPVLLGAHFRTLALAPGITPAHQLHMAADSNVALEMSPDLQAAYNKLVAEAGALFGARHYRGYHFLLSLSDYVAHFGLEHHESSDNRVAERSLIDPDKRKTMADLLPHEFVHSWNGKHRRPADLATLDFQQPMRSELLWVYEGLTQYLGALLSARSGLRTPDQYRENLALVAAELDHRSGRAWRPLADTATAAQILYGARQDWSDWRRGVDFYDESLLLWLEVDTILRQRTQGARTLDDFCRLFHGGQSGAPAVKTYTFEDVVAALNSIAPYDWKSFFQTRIYSTAPRAPLGGIENGGWRLAYTEQIPDLLRARENVQKTVDLSFSLGMKVKNDPGTDEHGAVLDVIPNMAAARAGVAPGMKLVAVNGRRWSAEVLREALKAAKGRSEPVELLVENREFFKTYRLDYHEGEKYPWLERDSTKPDLLSQILKPLTGGP